MQKEGSTAFFFCANLSVNTGVIFDDNFDFAPQNGTR
jgi:hypothetical protein